MANGVIQGAGLVFGAIGGILMIAAIMMPNWRQNDPSNNVIESIQTHQGLWSSCVSLTTGQWQCDGFDNFLLGLPERIKIARGLSIGALVFGLFGFISSFLAMKCISVLEENPYGKQKVGIISGCLWLLAGIGIGGAVSFYAYHVKREFEICQAQEVSLGLGGFGDSGARCHVFGPCLFLGWAAMFALLSGGGLIICGSCSVDVDERYNDSRVYANYSRVKRNLSNTWQRVARSESTGRNNNNTPDKTYV